ncbi:MAG: 1,2-diacylglycerol 3-alpha-glucosyltransferase [Candidatus Aldehydirespiratoraceae bacterium]|jgi:1,2-diacylglycerol 3-alpha-glucosyltransferase
MRIGLVSFWFNRGQATVMRTIRAALEELGHETFVLARPTEESFEKPLFVSSDDVWAQEGVTYASANTIPPEEYSNWVDANRIETAIVFQNLDTVGLGALRDSGARVVGTYMWEAFGPVEAAAVAPLVDRFFALNSPTFARYCELGLENVVEVPFCALPELAARARSSDISGGVRFIYMGGYLRARKTLGSVVEAFVRGAPLDARLTIKTQRPVRAGDFVVADDSRQLNGRYDLKTGSPDDIGPLDPRIDVVVGDESEDDFIELLQSHDVVVGVSRWEGLGLHLFEAEALGKRLLLNRMEPYIDFAATRDDCFVAESNIIGKRKVGLDVHEPDIDSMAQLFAQLGTPDRRPLRADHVAAHNERWERFVRAVELAAT